MTHSPVSLDRIIAKPRWNESEAREVLAALAASGLSVAAFARRCSVHEQRIYQWRHTFAERQDKIVPRTPAFVEVPTRPTVTLSSNNSARYEFTTAHGESLRIEGPLDPGAVRTLLALLREGRAC